MFKRDSLVWRAGFAAGLFAYAAGCAAARVYQWVDPASGSIHMSAAPPPWYRSPRPGPRVQVLDDGRVVDDTGIKLSPAIDAALRRYAERKFETQREAEALARVRAATEQREARAAAKKRAERLAEEARTREVAKASAAQAPGPPTAGEAAKLSPAAVEHLKALLEEYDRLANAASAGQAKSTKN